MKITRLILAVSCLILAASGARFALADAPKTQPMSPTVAPEKPGVGTDLIKGPTERIAPEALSPRQGDSSGDREMRKTDSEPRHSGKKSHPKRK